MIDRACIESLLAAHGKVAVAVVAEAKGSAPRDAGTLMAILPDQVVGTVGGGTVEHRVIQLARTMLAKGGAPVSHSFPLGPDLDQCCGGHMRIEIGLANPVGNLIWPGGPAFPMLPTRRPVILYGAGHVGQAVLHALSPLPFHVTMVDQRPDAVPTNDHHLVTPLPEAVAEAATGDTFHLVFTHSHAIDLEIVSMVLSSTFGFCGLIGSATKRAVFERRLAERGVAPETIAKLTCPIGLPLLKDKRPEVIAASVAAQMLLRDQELRGQR